MGAAGVAAVHRFFDGFNRRDIDTVLSAFERGAEMATVTSVELEDRGYHGHQGIRDYLQSVSEIWETLHLYPDDVRDLGGSVLVLGRWRSSGRESGAEVETPVAWIFQVSGSKITSSRAYRSHAEALRASGR